MTTNRCSDPSCNACRYMRIQISVGVYPTPRVSLLTLAVIMLGLSLGLGLVLGGCAEGLDDPCSVIADGTYQATSGESVTFAGGAPTGNWSCSRDSSCAGTLSCSPIGETVQTYVFRSAGADVEETVSPPNATVILRR
jgi:hypothetical protein